MKTQARQTQAQQTQAQGPLERLRSLVDSLSPDLRRSVRTPETVRRPLGWSSGLTSLDDHLIWRGFPRGEISLLTGQPGSGRTSLFLGAAATSSREGHWVAWVAGQTPLCPLPLFAHAGALQKGSERWRPNLQRFVQIGLPPRATPAPVDVWTLQLVALRQVLTSGLFAVVGCDLGHALPHTKDLRRLQSLAREHSTSLILISQRQQVFGTELLPLILGVESGQLEILRALHRPTPQIVQRRMGYEGLHRFASSALPAS